YLVYGQARLLDTTVPVYNLIVIAASLLIAGAIGWLLTRTAFGRIMRASADNREMAEALGVDMRSVHVRVFTPGTALGTLVGGPSNPRARRHERDGHRADRGGLRRGRDRRPREHARGLRGRARRRCAAGGRHRRVPGAGDAPHLPDRDRGASLAAARPFRRGG